MSVIHCDATRGAITMSLSRHTPPKDQGKATKRADPYYQDDTLDTTTAAIKAFLNRKK